MTQTLSPAHYDVPPGMIATVVTHLEMLAPPDPVPQPPAPSGITLQPHPEPSLDAYRAVFKRVGAPWLWFSRLELTDDALSSILQDPNVWIATVMHQGEAAGLLELDFRTHGACELAFFGLSTELTGKGVGPWLMGQAIAKAWSAPITRFHVHTCTLDSPHALAFYQKQGFKITRQQIEIAQDPRLIGGLPKSAAPQIPMIVPEAH